MMTMIMIMMHVIMTVFNQQSVALFALLFMSIVHIINSNFTFLYLVGLEGVGHHGVHFYLKDLAYSCGRYFYPHENPNFGGSFIENSVGKWNGEADWFFFRHYTYTGLQNAPGSQYYNAKSSHIGTILFSSSFPRNNIVRAPTSAKEIKNNTHYDLEGIVKSIQQINRNHPLDENITIKYLYLEREVFDTASSHCNFEHSVRNACFFHALYMSRYSEHIGREFDITNRLEDNLWRRVYFEWFLVPEQCIALMTSLASFLGFDQDSPGGQSCDFIGVCDKIRATSSGHIFKDRSHVNCSDYNFIMQHNVSLPGIPLLEGNFVRGLNESLLAIRKKECNNVSEVITIL